jgi:hypothetical protein
MSITRVGLTGDYELWGALWTKLSGGLSYMSIGSNISYGGENMKASLFAPYVAVAPEIKVNNIGVMLKTIFTYLSTSPGGPSGVMIDVALCATVDL